MRSDWKLVAMEDEVRLLSGGTPKKSEGRFWNGEIPWVSSGEMTQSRIFDTQHHVTEEAIGSGTRSVPKNTVLVVVRGMSLAKEFRVALTERRVTFNQDLKALRPSAKIDPGFLFYYLQSQRNAIRDRATDASHGTKKVETHVLKNWPLPLLSMKEQLYLRDILSAYDDLIENNRRRIQLLEQSARLLYKEWFVHLRFPGHEHVPVVDGVPEGWEEIPIGELIEDNTVDLQTGPFGTQLKAAEYSEDGIPVINVRNIGFGSIRPEKVEYVTEEKAMQLSKHILRPGDIVFGRKGAVDRHSLITSAEDGWLQGSDCIRMRIKTKKLSPIFASLAFREDSHKRWMVGQCGNKATMASLNQDVISRISLLIPSSEILLLFGGFVSRLFSQITVIQRQMSESAKARDLLLPRLMNGEIPV